MKTDRGVSVQLCGSMFYKCISCPWLISGVKCASSREISVLGFEPCEARTEMLSCDSSKRLGN